MIYWIPTIIFILNADLALATQAHSAPEGLYVHQIAHIFFACAMAILIYWLRKRALTSIIGWRHIQYAAFFFILWNIDTFFLHLFEEQLRIIEIKRWDHFNLQLKTASDQNLFAMLYYFLKLDHLFCVPALYFLYKGLGHLLKEIELVKGEKES